MREYAVGPNDAGQRVDRFLGKLFPHLPPSMIAKLIRTEKVRLDGKHPSASDRTLEGGVLRVYAPDSLLDPPDEEKAFGFAPPEPGDIIYEDGNLLLVDKPAGMVVHADESGSPDTLIARVQSYLRAKGEWDPEKENSFAPALCNRIDRNTSGIVIAAKNAPALRELDRLIAEREITKYYLCDVEGIPPQRGVLKYYLKKDGREKTVAVYERPVPGALTAITEYRRLEAANGRSLLECRLVTGRTHQIRASLAHAGYPIVGDGKYGRGGGDMMLCSYRLDFLPMESNGPLSYLKGRRFEVAPERVRRYKL